MDGNSTVNQLSRKRFLGGVGGTAGLIAGLLYPGVTNAARLTGADASLPSHTLNSPDTGFAQGSIIAINGPDPGFAQGNVVAKTPTGIVVETPTTARAIIIPPGRSVWKEFDVTIDAIEIGDYVDARGTPQVDGSLAVEPGWIWVNIGRSDGVIQSVGSRGLTLHGKATPARVDFSSRLDVIHSSDMSPVLGHVAALKPGMVIGSVGLGLPDGRLRATRIWIESVMSTSSGN